MGLLSTKRVASVLAAGAAMAALGTGVASATTYTNLVGEGASLQNLAQNSVWAPGYSSLSGGRTLTYTGNSSGAALASIGANATPVTPTHLEVYATDDPPTAAQIGNIRTNAGGTTGVEVIPVAQAAVAVIANLPTGCTGTGPLNATSAQVGRAFNTSASASDIFGTAVSGASCTTALTPIARSTTSGTTLNFKNYIAQRGYGGRVDAFATSWTSGVRPLASSGSNLVSLVNSTKGSIGYANLADAISGGLTTASTTAGFIANVDSQPAQVRSGTAFRSNCAGAVYTGSHSTTANEDWNGTFPDLSRTTGYPICALTYVLGYSDAYTSLPARSDGLRFTAAEGLSTAAYYQYITNALSGGSAINSQNYASLPGSIATVAANGAARIN